MLMCIVLMSHLPDNVFQAPGIPGKLLKFHFLSQLYQSCNQFSCILTGTDPEFWKRGPISVNSSYLLGIYLPPIPPEKHPKHAHNKKIIKFTPQIWSSPQSTKSRINIGSNI